MKLNVGLFNESFPPTIDGVSNCVFNYAKYLAKNHGNNGACTVVTPRYPHVVDDYPFEVYRYSSVDISKRLGYRVGSALSVKALKDLRAHRFDIIHVHSPFVSSLIARELNQFKPRVPVVLTYHTKYDVDIEKRVKAVPIRKMALKFLRNNIQAADEVWVVTEGAAESLRKIGYKGKYRVMTNGTDFPKGKAPEEEIEQLRTMYNIKEDELVFLFVGRMMWYKNVGLTLEALKKLGDDVKYKMVFVGDGHDLAAIEHYAQSLGIADKTVFAGAVYDRERVRAFFSMADLFLFPSTYDTSGLVVKEAAACLLPSVLVDGSCAAEEVVDDFSGFLCEENPDSMAKAIKRAVHNREHLKKVGQNAQDFVYLSWEEAVERAYKRYIEIVKAFKAKNTGNRSALKTAEIRLKKGVNSLKKQTIKKIIK